MGWATSLWELVTPGPHDHSARAKAMELFSGTISPCQHPPAPQIWAKTIAVADFDSDGKLDLY